MRRALAAGLVAASSAFAQGDLPCRRDDKPCAHKAIADHPVRNLSYWTAALAKPVGERIGPAPRELIEYLALDNIANGYPDRPRAPRLGDDFLADVQAALAALPPAVTAPLGRSLAGIYFIDDFGGTGFFDEIQDASGKAVAGFTVLDPSVLQRTANAWATWKENTPFRPGAGMKLVAKIQDAAGDTRTNAIQYILLHELGHMAAIGAGVHPSWRLQPKDMTQTERFAFFRLSWRHAPDRKSLVSVFDDDFRQRKDVVYYFGAKLGTAQMLPTYEALRRTNFVTLYGATNPFDDFAEAFASYAHVVVMRKPWEIRIERNGRLVGRYGPCWDEPRCAEKRRLLEELLSRR